MQLYNIKMKYLLKDETHNFDNNFNVKMQNQTARTLVAKMIQKNLDEKKIKINNYH